jgi:hypothetical protein
MAGTIDSLWLSMHQNFLVSAREKFNGPVLSTLALTADNVRSESQVELLIQHASSWDCEGFYLVAENPNGYLVDDPVWLANLLILTAGLKLSGKELIVGYCSHQLLCLAAARVDAICSGTWLNVRAFPRDKFYEPDEDEVSRRAKGGWYYCPHALSEYKMPSLDIAQRNGVLASMAPQPPCDPQFSGALFSGTQPSLAPFGEQNAFRHYLHSVHHQAADATKGSFQATYDNQMRVLDDAQRSLKGLRAKGVFGADRDFNDYVDVNRSALITFENAIGPRLRRSWA